MHRARHLRERIFDGVDCAATADRLPMPTDAPHAAALDLDDHHAEFRVGQHDIGLAIRRLVARPLLEP